MLTSRRSVSLLSIMVAFVLLLVFYRATQEAWRTIPQITDMEKAAEAELHHSNERVGEDIKFYNPESSFKPGTPEPPGYNYTRALIVPCLVEDDIDWIDRELPDIQAFIYVADNASAPLHPPKNKGHEGMTYLTYIIDHYNSLPDINVFMHAHRWAWHNADLLNNDAAQMVRRLSSARVIREGYMNMRCQWDPGCPDHIYPLQRTDDWTKKEQQEIGRRWAELFPLDPIPAVLGAPCCAQFALSRERIRAVPLRRYVFYRDWLLRTPLTDYFSGRVFEYVWQYIFTGNAVACPAQNACYCDGFGVCFGGEAEYATWFELRNTLDTHQHALREWHRKERDVERAKQDGRLDEAALLEIPELGMDDWLLQQIEALRRELQTRKAAAIERGKDPEARKLDLGGEGVKMKDCGDCETHD
ncbi:hypothetical protein BJ546DRAFT_427424 [Cryomyces antarcticus]